MCRGTLLIAGSHSPQDHTEWLSQTVGTEEARRIVLSEYRGHYSVGEVHVYVGEGTGKSARARESWQSSGPWPER